MLQLKLYYIRIPMYFSLASVCMQATYSCYFLNRSNITCTILNRYWGSKISWDSPVMGKGRAASVVTKQWMRRRDEFYQWWMAFFRVVIIIASWFRQNCLFNLKEIHTLHHIAQQTYILSNNVSLCVNLLQF